jgi:ATP-dependent helicase YprA (DUF1998 family)
MSFSVVGSVNHLETLGRNAIVKTGTGSGKTEAFMVAVMAGVLRMRAEGIRKATCAR